MKKKRIKKVKMKMKYKLQIEDKLKMINIYMIFMKQMKIKEILSSLTK